MNQVSHYRLLNKLGKGGMSEVYLAEDTALERRVAVKFLLPELLSNDRFRKRLMREAKAIASLDHPNICSIYEVNEDADQTFIVMQYIEGETLAVKMATDQITLKETIGIAIQVAAALVAAHSRGIIHRDIKPQNIMIGPNGLVKVLDFGLSKTIFHKPSDETDLTLSLLSNPGAIVGTVPYLSPEQARSEQLDARSDIFSFGIVLYEMATGRNPFAARNPADTIVAISTQSPPPLARYAADVPPELELIVAKCLEKNPERRYQSARELLIDLDHLQRTLNVNEIISERGSTFSSEMFPPTRRFYPFIFGSLLILAIVVAAYFYLNQSEPNTPIESVAVPPFEFTGNATLSADTRALMDWMSDSVASSLQELPTLKKVIAPYSISALKREKMTPQEVGQAYGVQAILIGRFNQLGNEITIYINLIDARDNSLIKGRTYSFAMSESNSAKGKICSQITEDLRQRLSSEQQSRLSQKETSSAEATIEYQKGREYWYKRHIQDVKTSIDYFKRALEKDPSYAKAHAGLADAYAVLAGSENPRENAMLARQEAEKALHLDGKLAEAFTSLGIIAFKFDWDWVNSEAKFREAIRLKPNSADAHYWYSAFLSAMGRASESVTEAKRTMELDPLNPTYRLHVARVLYLARRQDEALVECKQSISMNPNSAPAHYILGFINHDKKMYDAAMAEFQHALTLTEDKWYIKSAIGVTYASEGKKSEARQILEELKHPPVGSEVSPTDIAAVQIALGEKDEAFASLEQAYQDRSDLLAYLKVDPIYDSIRSDQRFGGLLSRVGLQ